MTADRRPVHGFRTVASGSSPGGPGCLLPFRLGEELEILQWSKYGWWWGRSALGGPPGWIPSALLQPALPEPNAAAGAAAAGRGRGAAAKEAAKAPAQKAAAPQAVQQPPPPPGPPPGRGCEAGSPPPVFPPLPPGPPPSDQPSGGGESHGAALPPLPPGPPPGEEEEEEDECNYEQSLVFRADGRVAKRAQEDHGLNQLGNFFDFRSWTESMNKQAQARRRQPKARPTGDGGLKRRRGALRALGFEVKKEDVRRMLADISKDPSQPIDFNDFCDMMRGRMPDKNSRAEIDKVFALFDEDETGKISFRNLKRIAQELGESLTDEELQEMIEEADRDGDGLINPDEFYRVMRKRGGNPLDDWDSDDD